MVATSSSSEALIVASSFIADSLRIRSLALTPMARERLRMLIGGVDLGV